ncbi:MAG: cation:proton antiporter [Candidatus Promineifilaceae bacterium]|nr:cation:proton antiporter [Candidatus Promineifilaceae bacterium]
MFTVWFILIGALFTLMALSQTVLSRLPLSTAMLYLLFGGALAYFGLADVEPIAASAWLERITEVAVIISLFTAGLKLRTPFSDSRWQMPVRLAFISMTVTVALIAFVGVAALGLPLGAAVLLGAVLAPTDPVLASDVQVEDPSDQDRLRFSLTGEAGLNDGVAFPFVMLGLGLLGLHELGAWGWRWLAVDVVWAIAGGLAIGALMGWLVGHLVLYLRRHHKEAVGSDDFLSIGLIALSYGLALLLATYGFLAVFAAGVALRRVEKRAGTGDEEVPPEVEAAALSGEEAAVATDPDHAPAYMAKAVLGFNEQLERIAVLAVVLLVGVLLAQGNLPAEALWFVPLLLLVIRPLATWVGLWGAPVAPSQRRLIAWFGIRGIGSLYYLMFALQHGVPRSLGMPLVGLVLATVASSVVVHGVSVTPLMNAYARARGRALG